MELYHLAPTSERARIQAHGIIASDPRLHEQWGYFTHGWEYRPPAIYALDNVDSAHALRTLYGGESGDIWQIVTPLNSNDVTPDPYHAGGFMILRPQVDAALFEPFEESDIAEIRLQDQAYEEGTQPRSTDWRMNWGYEGLDDIGKTFRQWGIGLPNHVMGKTANIMDPIHDELDQTVFAGINPRPSKVKFIRDHFMDGIKSLVADPEHYFDFYLTGSLTTYQYSDESDADVSVFPKYDELATLMGVESADAVRKLLITEVINHIDGAYLPGTTHPLQHFVVLVGNKPEDLYRPGLRSAWDFQTRDWLVPPERERTHNVMRELPLIYLRAHAIAEKMRVALASDPDAAKRLFKRIHIKRTNDQRAGRGDFSEGNIVYKYLLHEGLFDQLRNIGIFIAKTEEKMAAAPAWTPETHNETGMPRPMYDQKPVPWTSDIDKVDPTIPNFSVIDSARQFEAFKNNRCVLCGEPLTDPVHCFGNSEGQLIDGGLHPRCARMTAAWCPHIKNELANGSYDEVTVPLQDWINEKRDDYGAFVRIPENNFLVEGVVKEAMPPATQVNEFRDLYRETFPPIIPTSTREIRGYDWVVSQDAIDALYEMEQWGAPPLSIEIMDPRYDTKSWRGLLGIHQYQMDYGQGKKMDTIKLHPFQTIQDANATLWHEIQHAYQRLEGRMDQTNYNWQNPNDPSQYSEHPIEVDADTFAEAMKGEPLVDPAAPLLKPEWVPRELHLDIGDWNEETEDYELSPDKLQQHLAAQVQMFRQDRPEWASTWQMPDDYYSKVADTDIQVIYDFNKDRIILGTKAESTRLPNTVLIGVYRDGNVTMYEAAHQWINTAYFKKLWLQSYPDRPLHSVHLHSEKGRHRIGNATT